MQMARGSGLLRLNELQNLDTGCAGETLNDVIELGAGQRVQEAAQFSNIPGVQGLYSVEERRQSGPGGYGVAGHIETPQRAFVHPEEHAERAAESGLELVVFCGSEPRAQRRGLDALKDGAAFAEIARVDIEPAASVAEMLCRSIGFGLEVRALHDDALPVGGVGLVAALLKAVRDLMHEDGSKTSEKQFANTSWDMNHISGGYCQRADSIRKAILGDANGGEILLKEALQAAA